MISLTELPSEILSSICFHADQRSRKALGSTCWLLRDVCKQWIFHSIGVSSTSWSCERFKNLLAAPHLSQYVTKICLDTDIWRLQVSCAMSTEMTDAVTDVRERMTRVGIRKCIIWIILHPKGLWFGSTAFKSSLSSDPLLFSLKVAVLMDVLLLLTASWNC